MGKWLLIGLLLALLGAAGLALDTGAIDLGIGGSKSSHSSGPRDGDVRTNRDGSCSRYWTGQNIASGWYPMSSCPSGLAGFSISFGSTSGGSSHSSGGGGSETGFGLLLGCIIVGVAIFVVGWPIYSFFRPSQYKGSLGDPQEYPGGVTVKYKMEATGPAYRLRSLFGADGADRIKGDGYTIPLGFGTPGHDVSPIWGTTRLGWFLGLLTAAVIAILIVAIF